MLGYASVAASTRHFLTIVSTPTTVNNVEKGQGSGTSKQLAKHEAAKQAFYAMGWSTQVRAWSPPSSAYPQSVTFLYRFPHPATKRARPIAWPKTR